MIAVWTVVFIMSLVALMHTYLIYPILMRFLAKGKSTNDIIYKRSDDLPVIVVLMAAYNEEKVISQKLDSLLNQDYPRDKIFIYIGSDNSTDQTNDILSSYTKKYNHFYFTPFTTRQGKTGIINKLVDVASTTHTPSTDLIFLMTDASVILEKDVFYHLVKHFKNKEIALVDAHMNYSGIRENDISTSESAYLNMEVILKQSESKVSKKMIGPFGGCYALRSTYYEAVPSNRLVDDFYIAMKVFEKRGLIINDLDALCHETVSHDMASEYRRKKRISAGNFQNLMDFISLLNPVSWVGFSYISHKVLRWKGPFFLIAIMVASIFLMRADIFLFKYIFIGQILWYTVPPIMLQVCTLFKLECKLLRSVTYFNLMNLALLHGFFKYLGGIKTAIWQPVERS